MDQVVVFAIAMMLIAGIPLLYFHYHNHDSIRVERFWHQENKNCYYILEFCVFFLTLCIAIYSRVVISHYMTIAKIYMISKLPKKIKKILPH